MSRLDVKRAAVVLLLALSVVSCSDDDSKDAKVPDGGRPGDSPDANDAGHDAGVDAAKPADIDSAVDAGAVVDGGTIPVVRVSCLDRPNALVGPPVGPLPCELLPPGVALAL